MDRDAFQPVPIGEGSDKITGLVPQDLEFGPVEQPLIGDAQDRAVKAFPETALAILLTDTGDDCLRTVKILHRIAGMAHGREAQADQAKEDQSLHGGATVDRMGAKSIGAESGKIVKSPGPQRWT